VQHWLALPSSSDPMGRQYVPDTAAPLRQWVRLPFVADEEVVGASHDTWGSLSHADGEGGENARRALVASRASETPGSITTPARP
jgi:hypothetical protein